MLGRVGTTCSSLGVVIRDERTDELIPMVGKFFMDLTVMASGATLLDESVVYFGSELSEPPSHDKHDMPYLLAGKGGGLLPGRYVQYPETSHNDLLLGILHLFGLTDLTSVGTPEYSRGVLPKLTSLA